MIGYYVHHQGRGHLTRAGCLARALADDVVGLSSLAPPPPDAGFAGWVRLPADDTADPAVDPAAHSALHWAPIRSTGVARRTAALTAWVARHRPRAVVVDVSVEAAIAVRLAGCPVVVVALPGRRDDAAHQLAFRVADRVLAFWNRAVYDPSWLHPHADRVAWVGALSRFDGRDPGRGAGVDARSVLVLGGAGGGVVSPAQLAAAAAATPGWQWRLAGPGAWHDDPWPALAAAGVVVTHGGQNALAEAAAARRPTVVVPQPRPYAEQVDSTEALHRAGVVVRLPGWPEATSWPDTLARARALDPAAWSRWSPGDAAARAAAEITAVAAAGPAWDAP